MGAKDIDIKFKGFYLSIILVYLIILCALYLYFSREIIAFTPILYHILHAIVIGIFTFFACYVEIIAEKKVKVVTKVFTTISIVLIFVFFAVLGTEGILKFSTLFSSKEKSSVECVRIVSTYTESRHNISFAKIKMHGYSESLADYKITKEEKTFIDKHIDSCVCIELLFYKSPLIFPYAEVGKKKGVIKLCDEKSLKAIK